MTEYKHFLEEAAKRDHRKIGKVGNTVVLSLKAYLLVCHAGTRAVLFQRPQSRKRVLLTTRYKNLQRSDRAPTCTFTQPYRLMEPKSQSCFQAEYFKRGYQEGAIVLNSVEVSI